MQGTLLPLVILRCALSLASIWKEKGSPSLTSTLPALAGGFDVRTHAEGSAQSVNSEKAFRRIHTRAAAGKREREERDAKKGKYRFRSAPRGGRDCPGSARRRGTW